jgi:hypothetical protein
MPRSLPEPAKALAREIVRDLIDGRVPAAGTFNQTTLAARLGQRLGQKVEQSTVGRLYQVDSRAGCSYQLLMALAEIAGRDRDARAALGEDVLVESELPEELAKEIARDPSRTAGIDAARTLAHAKGQRLTQEEWRAFIDHGQRLRGAPVAEPDHEDAMAAQLKAKKSAKKRPRLEVINGGGP